MAIQMTHTAFNPGSYPTRAAQDHEGWVPQFDDEPAPVTLPNLRSMAAVSAPAVNSLVELVQPTLLQPQDTTTLSPSIDTDDDELRGVFAEMALDRQNRVAARAQLAQTVSEDWTKAQEEVRTNEQMRQTNMSNMWRSTFNPYGGGMMPMPMTPMAPPMAPGLGQPQLGMQVSMPGQPGMLQPGVQPGMQPGMPGAPGMPMTGTFNTFPAAPGAYPTATTAYPAPPGTMSAAMVGAPPYYYR